MSDSSSTSISKNIDLINEIQSHKENGDLYAYSLSEDGTKLVEHTGFFGRIFRRIKSALGCLNEEYASNLSFLLQNLDTELKKSPTNFNSRFGTAFPKEKIQKVQNAFADTFRSTSSGFGMELIPSKTINAFIHLEDLQEIIETVKAINEVKPLPSDEVTDLEKFYQEKTNRNDKEEPGTITLNQYYLLKSFQNSSSLDELITVYEDDPEAQKYLSQAKELGESLAKNRDAINALHTLDGVFSHKALPSFLDNLEKLTTSPEIVYKEEPLLTRDQTLMKFIAHHEQVKTALADPFIGSSHKRNLERLDKALKYYSQKNGELNSNDKFIGAEKSFNELKNYGLDFASLSEFNQRIAIPQGTLAKNNYIRTKISTNDLTQMLFLSLNKNNFEKIIDYCEKMNIEQFNGASKETLKTLLDQIKEYGELDYFKEFAEKQLILKKLENTLQLFAPKGENFLANIAKRANDLQSFDKEHAQQMLVYFEKTLTSTDRQFIAKLKEAKQDLQRLKEIGKNEGLTEDEIDKLISKIDEYSINYVVPEKENDPSYPRFPQNAFTIAYEMKCQNLNKKIRKQKSDEDKSTAILKAKEQLSALLEAEGRRDASLESIDDQNINILLHVLEKGSRP